MARLPVCHMLCLITLDLTLTSFLSNWYVCTLLPKPLTFIHLPSNMWLACYLMLCPLDHLQMYKAVSQLVHILTWYLKLYLIIHILNTRTLPSTREMGNYLNQILGWDIRNCWPEKSTLTEEVSRQALFTISSIYSLPFTVWLVLHIWWIW